MTPLPTQDELRRDIIASLANDYYEQLKRLNALFGKKGE